MKKLPLALGLLALLAACGVDGAPTPPKPKPQSGVTLSGSARVGVAAKL